MSFRTWLESLRYDALKTDFPLKDLNRSTFSRIVSLSEHVLYSIYLEGVRPTVDSIILWAESDAAEAFMELDENERAA